MSWELLERIAIMAVPVVLAITLHEAAHGWVAWRRGDPTARDLGRLSMNPLRHVDPVGTVLVPILMVIGSKAAGLEPVVFGWAKPVPVDMRRLFSPRRDMALVALAGPGSNLLMGFAWALVARFTVVYHASLGDVAAPLLYMAIAGIFANAIIMVLNLLPLPPLDGGRVLVCLLPLRAARAVSRLEPFGLIIMVIALVSGVLWAILGPMVSLTTSAMSFVAGLSRIGLF